MKTAIVTIAVIALVVMSLGAPLKEVEATSLWSGATIKDSCLFVDSPTPILQVNDLVVIFIEEKTSATTDADTDAEVKDKVEGSISNWFSIENFGPILQWLRLGNSKVSTKQNDVDNLPKWGIEIKNEFEGEGMTTRNSTVVAQVSARVAAVKPNGTVMLEGKRNIKINSEYTTLMITGTARARDISENNTIHSSLIADLKLSIDGKGIVSAVNRRGIISYIFNLIR
ncbi:MAG: flagellar basal body L-ring protein FlgH [Candidatus Omnitrophica bacterium]|nr:flagellar basal body L-ring protein FlgH [Candidatus Omnitrophota bacterium]